MSRTEADFERVKRLAATGLSDYKIAEITGVSRPTVQRRRDLDRAPARGIFMDHCAPLGVRVTQPNHRNLAVSHRDSVTILDSFIGPKR